MNYTDRERVASAINRYKIFVDEVEVGYRDNIYEYRNDLGCRDIIDRYLNTPIINDGERNDISLLDARFKSMLMPTIKPISPRHPTTAFWYYGMPHNISGELLEDARADGLLP
jgi:hypothetical protein